MSAAAARPKASSEKFYELIYVSTLAPDAAINAVPDISRWSRAANPPLGITGLLVFDGHRFCQQIEGTPNRVVELFDRISQDTRHTEVCMVHQGFLAKKRFLHFSVGHPFAEAGDTLGDIEQLEGQAAIAAFMAMTPLIHMT